MKVWVIGGTVEARLFCEKAGYLDGLELFVTTVRKPVVPYPVPVSVGRVDAVWEKEDYICVDGVRVDLVVDFSHPHAVGLRRLLEGLSRDRIIAYQRKGVVKDEYRLVDSYDEMAVRLKEMRVGSLLAFLGAKGGKNLLDSMRRIRYAPKVYLRSICRVEGVEYIPFEIGRLRDVKKLIKEIGPEVVVFKDSGVEGGTLEKISACKSLGVPYIALRMPRKVGGKIFFSLGDVVNFLKRRLYK